MGIAVEPPLVVADMLGVTVDTSGQSVALGEGRYDHHPSIVEVGN